MLMCGQDWWEDGGVGGGGGLSSSHLPFLDKILVILLPYSKMTNKNCDPFPGHIDNFVHGWPLDGIAVCALPLMFMFPAKSQELKRDIEILSQTFERVIDRKEAIIKSLAKDIEEAEEQYQMALRSNLQNVDRLIGELETF